MATSPPLQQVLDSHAHFESIVAQMPDAHVRAPSALPGWTVAHVIAHVGDNARVLTRVVDHALRGELVPSYDGGQPERDGIIGAMARSSAADLKANLAMQDRRLEAIWDRVMAAEWQLPILMWDATLGFTVFTRWREVWVHALDLQLGLAVSEWPADFAEHVVDFLLCRLPPGVVIYDTSGVRRWHTGGPVNVTVRGDVQDLAAWLAQRRAADRLSVTGGLPELRPWPVDPATTRMAASEPGQQAGVGRTNGFASPGPDEVNMAG
jgi:maleylpyruvate isomerase